MNIILTKVFLSHHLDAKEGILYWDISVFACIKAVWMPIHDFCIMSLVADGS